MDRRSFLTLSATSGALVANPSAKAAAAGGGSSVTGLRAAQIVNPLGLSDRRPWLSWRMTGDRPGARQLAYQIRVASTPAALQAGGADLWDSGKVVSATSSGVAYDGEALGSRQRVWWTVTVWDDRGRPLTARPAWWEAPLLAAEDWTGQWIAAESAEERDDRLFGLPFFSAPAPVAGAKRLFRLPFNSPIDGEAVLTIFSSGFLESLTVDGTPLPIPPHPYIAFGGPPAHRMTLRLAAGPHMIGVEVSPARTFVPETTVSVAAQLHLPTRSASPLRVNTGWQTALSAEGEWRQPGSSNQGWSAPPPRQPQPHGPWPASPALMMRRAFAAPHRARRARLYVAALGAYEMRINGHRVGQDVLQSETSDFRKTVLYRTYDVTDLVREGDNVIAALVGDGWYASYAAPVGRYPFGPAPRRLIAQLEIEDPAGTRTTIVTDPTWRITSSPIRASELYNGETYDARLEQPGWDAPGFDDAAWSPCWSAEPPAGQLLAQAGPAVRAIQTLKPKSQRRLASGAVVVDFGQNFAGVAKLTVKGAAGSVVTLRFAELLGADGAIDQSNLRAARANDRYTLRGDPAGETFTPRFTYHGFRYVQVEGAPADWSIEGVVLGSDLVQTGLLKIEQPLVQQFWLNTLWSQKSNLLAIPTDCPQRDERLGWTGDAQVFWDTAAFNMDVGAFTRRFLHDLRDAQTPKGAFPMYAPIVQPPIGASPGWGDAGVMLPWICWRRYGDLAMAQEHWDAMTAFIEGVIADNPDLIWRKVLAPNFGDWLSLDAKNAMDETTPKALVGAAMLKRSLDQVADLGQALGKTLAADRYRAHAAAAAKAFQAAFVRPDGSIGNGSQTGYILAIRLGLLDERQRTAAGRLLAADIRRRGTLLSTGFLGTPLSLDAIADVGDVELVYDLLLRSEFPSWGYMVKKGATTIWERWDGDTGDVAMNSFNHYALGAVCGFLYRRIAGIEELEPGFSRFSVNPLIDARVPSAGADYDSVQGRISTRWTLGHDGGFDLALVVPANTQAEVHLPPAPGSAQDQIGYQGLGASKVLRHDAGRPVVLAQAGRHRFTSRAPVRSAAPSSRQ